MHPTLKEILGRTTLEEREVIERWFQNFQTIGLSKRQGMSTARGAAMACQLSQRSITEAKINQVDSLRRQPFQLGLLNTSSN